MLTILIADDEPDIREILSFNLGRAGYRCLMASDGRQALRMLGEQSVDLALLDVMMPELSGFEVARAIRNDEVPGVPYDLPIIFLTALGEEADQLMGFSLGGDDYITKPFSIRLLLARIEAVMKRKTTTAPFTQGDVKAPLPASTKGEIKPADVCYDQLLLSATTFSATIGGEDIGLTKMEYELLYFLLTHQRNVFSRSEILQHVWPDNGLVLDRTVDVTIARLRKKIGTYKDHLKAKTGYGYYWEK